MGEVTAAFWARQLVQQVPHVLQLLETLAEFRVDRQTIFNRLRHHRVQLAVQVGNELFVVGLQVIGVVSGHHELLDGVLPSCI